MIDWILFFKNHVVLTVLCLDSLIQHNVLKTASCFLFYYILSSVYQCSYWWPPRLIPGFSNTNKAAMNIFVKGIGEHYVLISFGLNIYLWSCWIIEKICFLFSFNCRSSPKWFVPFHMRVLVHPVLDNIGIVSCFILAILVWVYNGL